MRPSSLLYALALAFITGCAPGGEAPADGPALTPQEAVDELLAADRAFSAASAQTDVISGISPMLADDVVMGPIPGFRFAHGKPEAIEALKANPLNANGKLEWTPIRGGISADGQHGFTFGYGVLQHPDSAPIPLKYLAYWVKQPQGWRVAVYKRARRAEGDVSMELLPAALPAAMAPGDSSTLATHRSSLDSVERAFSAEAQVIGLGAAFAKFGSPDAVNMGGPNDVAFVVHSDSIGRKIGGDGPTNSSPVSWGPDQVIVAASGDLGVTIGMIRPNTPPAAGEPAGFPFFTIWRRASPQAAWRYIAE